jgi:hypothetical protein
VNQQQLRLVNRLPCRTSRPFPPSVEAPDQQPAPCRSGLRRLVGFFSRPEFAVISIIFGLTRSRDCVIVPPSSRAIPWNVVLFDVELE